MVVHPIRALGVSGLRVNNPNPRRRVPQVLLDGGEGMAWHILGDMHPAEAGPRPIMDTLYLSPSGQTLLGRVPEDAAPAAGARSQTQRLALIDVATGHQQLTPFVQRGRDQLLHYGLAPNERDLAVALVQMTGEEEGHVTLTIVRGPDLTVSTQRVFNGVYMVPNLLSAQMQWSPDGRLLALSVLPRGPLRGSLLILDTETLETVLQVDPPQRSGVMKVAGSASWSPDSQRLAILADDYQRILHLADGRQEKLEWLKGPQGDPPLQPQILGLLPGDRALLQRQRGPRLRLRSVDLATGKGPILANLTVSESDDYLKMAVSREWENIPPASQRRKSSRSNAHS